MFENEKRPLEFTRPAVLRRIQKVTGLSPESNEKLLEKAEKGEFADGDLNFTDGSLRSSGAL